MKKSMSILALTFLSVFLIPTNVMAQEQLDRGLVALERADGSVFLSWRLLQSDPSDIRFVLVRSTPDGKQTTLTKKPITQTNCVDNTAAGQNQKGFIYHLYQRDNRSKDNDAQVLG